MHKRSHGDVRDRPRGDLHASMPAIELWTVASPIARSSSIRRTGRMDGWRADLYLDVSEIVDEYLAVLRSHALSAAASTFRYLDYYDALGMTRGCLGGFRKAKLRSWSRLARGSSGPSFYRRSPAPGDAAPTTIDQPAKRRFRISGSPVCVVPSVRRDRFFSSNGKSPL